MRSSAHGFLSLIGRFGIGSSSAMLPPGNSMHWRSRRSGITRPERRHLFESSCVPGLLGLLPVFAGGRPEARRSSLRTSQAGPPVPFASFQESRSLLVRARGRQLRSFIPPEARASVERTLRREFARSYHQYGRLAASAASERFVQHSLQTITAGLTLINRTRYSRLRLLLRAGYQQR